MPTAHDYHALNGQLRSVSASANELQSHWNDIQSKLGVDGAPVAEALRAAIDEAIEVHHSIQNGCVEAGTEAARRGAICSEYTARMRRYRAALHWWEQERARWAAQQSAGFATGAEPPRPRRPPRPAPWVEEG